MIIFYPLVETSVLGAQKNHLIMFWLKIIKMIFLKIKLIWRLQYSCFTLLFVPVSNSYAIKNLENERKYLVNADIHVCFETRANCIHEFTILSDAMFQKEDCNWARGFAEPGLSILCYKIPYLL